MNKKPGNPHLHKKWLAWITSFHLNFSTYSRINKLYPQYLVSNQTLENKYNIFLSKNVFQMFFNNFIEKINFFRQAL